MPRISVITGSASGIGRATKELLEERGERVIGVDIHDAEVVADLSAAEGRGALVDAVRKVSGGRIDAIYAVAGLAVPGPATVAVNFFGAVATLEKLRPLLAGSDAPRAVVVSSMAALMASDEELVALLTAGDEQAAMARAEVLAKEPATGGLIYSSTKLALSRWVRRQAAGPEWAGAGIPLNAVSPGVIATPMTADLIDTEQEREGLLKVVPMPLNGIAEPIVVARLLAWLNSLENTHLCGQIVYVDGGSDVVLRGDSVW
ncbi:SDR family oxidoreductase [Arthrobacter sp. Soil764]|uniref:SDR family oxidoreductase n=1 Tax=Arthrobacter sp. Soil764 TaxID=1736403 RepID=UPI0006F6D82C|nr:SDR family oxidoreductase [Arthrobacter sp. Soil764]KRE88150.1 short-chain dehydrogenase [Arthrobacter sp. Soil764]